MATTISYKYLCIPVEGDVFVITRTGMRELVRSQFSGIMIGYQIKDNVIDSIHEYVDGRPQNRCSFYNLNRALIYDGFIGKNMQVFRNSEGEIISYYDYY